MTAALLTQRRSDDEGASLVTAPLAYGYMRVPAEAPDWKVRRLEQSVIRYAGRGGLTFAQFFFEFHCGSREGFDDLVTELVRSEARHVVVPSLRHLAHNAHLQIAMCDQLELAAGAQVHAMRVRTVIE
jgi:hypothetical protein